MTSIVVNKLMRIARRKRERKKFNSNSSTFGWFTKIGKLIHDLFAILIINTTNYKTKCKVQNANCKISIINYE